MNPAVRRHIERRTASIRRDLNDVVRDRDNRLSPQKIGMIIGQMISVHILLYHTETILKSWDILSVLFTVLLAPEFWKRLVEIRMGAAAPK